MLVKQQAVVQNFCTKLEGFIKQGYELRKALQAVVPVYNQASTEQQIEMRDKVAELIGRLKGVKPKRLEKGAYKGYLGFDAHGSDTENQARTMLQYYFPIKIVPKGKKGSPQSVAKQVDLVEKALELVESLTKAQQDKFFARVTRKK